MLYKKFHRNFVRQFKVGTKIKVGSYELTILKGPHPDLYHPSWIVIEDYFMIRELISPINGKIRRDIKVINRR